MKNVKDIEVILLPTFSPPFHFILPREGKNNFPSILSYFLPLKGKKKYLVFFYQICFA